MSSPWQRVKVQMLFGMRYETLLALNDFLTQGREFESPPLSLSHPFGEVSVQGFNAWAVMPCAFLKLLPAAPARSKER